jgi:hypothetical protein
MGFWMLEEVGGRKRDGLVRITKANTYHISSTPPNCYCVPSLTHSLNAFVESLLGNIVSMGMMGWKKNGQTKQDKRRKKKK